MASKSLSRWWRAALVAALVSLVGVVHAEDVLKLHVQPIDNRVPRHLTSRRVDLSIQPRGMVTGFESQLIFKDEWVCAAWREHPEVGDRLTREQFFALPHAEVGEMYARKAADQDRWISGMQRFRSSLESS